jgi:DNA polymerase-3 subunit alpha
MLRYYHPLEFTTALLNNANNDEDIISGTTLARQKGITLHTPKFRKSNVGYTYDAENNSIYKGIDSIKFLNVTVAEQLYELRSTEFTDFVALLYYLKENSTINTKQLNILIRLDYFAEFGNINYLLEVVTIFDKFYKCKTLKKTPDADLWLYKKYAQKETEKTFSGIDNKGLVSEMCKAKVDTQAPTSAEMISYQIELLGYADIIDETAEPSFYVVEKIESNQWGNTFITLYQMNSGIRQSMKVAKKWYEEYPCSIGNILNAVITAKERYTKLEGATKTTPTGEFEIFLKLYSILN